jgi:hypothetical protein
LQKICTLPAEPHQELVGVAELYKVHTVMASWFLSPFIGAQLKPRQSDLAAQASAHSDGLFDQ